MPYIAIKPCHSRGRNPFPDTIFSVNRGRKDRVVHLGAVLAVAKSAGTALDNLLLRDGDDVGGDVVELGTVLAGLSKSDIMMERTPRLLRRSLVSWSTSREPDSLFWVKSRAEISGTY